MSTTDNPRTLALIGAGYWGKNLARNFNALGVLHTLCDARAETLAAYTGGYEPVRKTQSVRDLWNDPAVAQVAIASPAAAHYAIVRTALESGRDVFVEKPLCLDEREAETLVSLAEQSKRILMVGHLLQYHPCVQKIQALLAAGELGKLHYITSNRLNLGKIRREENALWSFAPHDISVILSLAGNGVPEQVRCVGEDYLSDGIADTTLTSLRFADRVRAHVYVSWLNPFKEQKLTVVGSRGMAVFDDTRPWAEKLVVHREYMTWTNGQVPTPSKNKGEPVPVPESEPLRNECQHFLDCCRDRTTPRTDGREGLRVLRVLQMAQQSLEADGEAVGASVRQCVGTPVGGASVGGASVEQRAKGEGQGVRGEEWGVRGEGEEAKGEGQRARGEGEGAAFASELPGCTAQSPSPVPQCGTPSPIGWERAGVRGPCRASSPETTSAVPDASPLALGSLQKDYFVHSSAFVDDGAVIGKGTKIWHFSHVMKGAEIGERCIIGQNVNVDGGTRLGNNVKVQNNVSIYTGAEIEDDVFLGPSCVLTNVTNPRSQVNRHSLYERTVIKRGATVGANATIVCGVTLGRYCFIGAGSVVTKDVPDYALMVGNPARQRGWISRHGHMLKPGHDGLLVCPESGYRYALATEGDDGQRAMSNEQSAKGKEQRAKGQMGDGRSEIGDGRSGERQGVNRDVTDASRFALSSSPLARRQVLRCLDLDEEQPLPPNLSKGTRKYDDFKAATAGAGRSD
mgnify:CR=1 FL=1